MIDVLLSVVVLAMVFLLMLPSVGRHELWRATITPLASIIGSGFLIVAPLLAEIVGKLAPFAMTAIVAVAFAIGAVVRFNIRYAEPLLKEPDKWRPIAGIEQMSRAVLVLAYIVSITFYLRLMSSFVLEGLGVVSPQWASVLTTGILVFIGVAGAWRGLGGLERLEAVSVSLKLAIIVALLVGLTHHNIVQGYRLDGLTADHLTRAEQLGMFAGMLLVVQGFETSRYLGGGYSASVRIKSMRLAQLIAAAVYILFVISLLPLMHHLEPGKPDETAIIALSAFAATVLPLMLIIAAVMSQFSAAVADTIGAGGLIEEQMGERIKPAVVYMAVMLFGILLVWSSNIFEIVAFASRAFAAYYFLQTLIAILITVKFQQDKYRFIRLIALAAIATLLFGVLLFAKPVG